MDRIDRDRGGPLTSATAGVSEHGVESRDAGVIAVRVAAGAASSIGASPGWPGWQHHPLKRVLDVAIAGPALLLCLPLMLLIAIAIRIDSPGPILYRQRRVGRGGRPFRMFKFRTMRQGADELLHQKLVDEPEALAAWHQHQKLRADPRITPLGRILRRLSLDELPQLWNVLAGEMSLVGPRPILPEQAEEYGAAFHGYIQMRPGLTGLWQVSGRNRLSFRARVEWDERYRSACSPALDLRVLASTIVVVAIRDGAW